MHCLPCFQKCLLTCAAFNWLKELSEKHQKARWLGCLRLRHTCEAYLQWHEEVLLVNHIRHCCITPVQGQETDYKFHPAVSLLLLLYCICTWSSCTFSLLAREKRFGSSLFSSRLQSICIWRKCVGGAHCWCHRWETECNQFLRKFGQGNSWVSWKFLLLIWMYSNCAASFVLRFSKPRSKSALHKQKWPCVYTWSGAQLQERSWGENQILLFSQMVIWTGFRAICAIPEEMFWCCSLWGSGRHSWLLYNTPISPVINCLSKDRLSNYGCALQSITPMLYSQTAKQGSLCVCHRQLLRFHQSRGGVSSGSIALFFFIPKKCLGFDFFFFFFQKSRVLVL